MLTRNAITRTTLSTFAFLTVCLICPVVLAQAPAEPQQGASNTTRSNIKNTSRLDPKVDTVQVELSGRLGGLSGQLDGLSDTWRQIQTKNGEFDLGVLPKGEYALRFQLGDKLGSETTRKAPVDSAKVNPDQDRFTVTLTGVEGGTLVQKLEKDLSSQLGSDTARVGNVKYKNIVLRSDGKAKIAGRVVVDRPVKRPR